MPDAPQGPSSAYETLGGRMGVVSARVKQSLRDFKEFAERH